jgi:hypothetical protein
MFCIIIFSITVEMQFYEKKQYLSIIFYFIFQKKIHFSLLLLHYGKEQVLRSLERQTDRHLQQLGLMQTAD